ncbi:YdeI/OmpD-associated family protein [Rhodococcus triatomae]
MIFRSEVEPPEPMRGLEVPADVVASLSGGRRPRVTVTVNGHTWSTRIAVMRGRNLIGLSKANRAAAGIETGEHVEVDVELDTEPDTVTEPADFQAALTADESAESAYRGLTVSRRRQHVRHIEGAKKPETRRRRIADTIEELSRRAH